MGATTARPSLRNERGDHLMNHPEIIDDDVRDAEPVNAAKRAVA
jgi:hypothetical protein